LSKDYERKVQTSETFIQVAMIRLLLVRAFAGNRTCSPTSFEYCGCLATSRKIKTPVIAPHETALGVLELAFLDECEPQFPAEGVRWRVVNRWEGVQRPILAF
jgi:hypothetical protein